MYKIITHKPEKPFYVIELEWYEGSLDWPCTFCESNSYNNFHLKVDNKTVVICKDCLKKVEETQ